MPRLLLVLVFAATAAAQTARLSGTVSDSSGAVVPSASVAATNVETGIVRTTESNEEGLYALPALNPGQYRITAKANGFRILNREGVVLTVNQVARLDLELAVGQVTEEVTVSSDALMLETATAALGNVVNNRQVADLPLNRRQVLGLMLLSPNVRPGPGYDPTNWGNSLNISVNGSRDRSIEVLFDGTPALAVGPTAAGSSLPAYSPSVESIREFRMVTNALAAEYGYTSAGMLSVASKTGTNELHGSAYDYLRNSALDANNFFNNRAGIPLTSFKRNQYGGSIGGPVWLPKTYNGRNRTFFFFAYEGLRSDTGANVLRTVPTTAMKEGDFSALRNAAGQPVLVYDPLTTAAIPGGYSRQPFSGNRVPLARFDATARSVIQYWPAANNPGLPFTQANNFIQGSATTFDSDQFDFRGDHRFNDRHSVYGRYSLGSNINIPPRPFGRGDTQSRALKTRNLALDYTWIQSPSTVVNAHFGYSRLGDVGEKPGYKVTDATFSDGLVKSLNTLYDGVYNGIPTIAPDDVSLLELDRRLWHSPFTTYQSSGSVTHTHGRHTIKAGGELRHYFYGYVPFEHRGVQFNFARSMTQGPDPLRATTTGGWGFASFLIGAGTGTTQPSASIPKQMRAPALAGYIQDDWKATKKLTLNIGLRYDLFFPRVSTNDELSWFDLGVPNPLSQRTGLNLRGGLQFANQSGNPRRQTGFAKNNWGPRVGFAYQTTSRTVLRGGFGVLYPQQTNSVESSGSEGFFTLTTWLSSVDNLFQQDTLSRAFASGLNQATRGSLGLLELAGQTFSSKFPAHFEPTYNLQWHFSAQTQLTDLTQVELSYVGNRGLHLPMPATAFNQLTPEQMTLGAALVDRVPNPFFGIIPSGVLSGPTTTRGQLLRPYPHFDSVSSDQAPLASSTYHGLSVSLAQRSRYGHSAQLSYTASKLIDDSSALFGGIGTQGVQNVYNLRAERSVASNDISSRFVMSGLAPLPFGKGQPLWATLNRWQNAIFGGWQITGIFTAQTGIPIGLTAQNSTGSLGGGQRPNSTGISAELTGRTQDRLSRFFDTSQFTQPAPFTFGNVARTLPDVRGPGLVSLDASLGKTFGLTERVRMQFRAEAFNLTNTPVFGLPGTALGNATFGVITSQANLPRQLQLALRLDF